MPGFEAHRVQLAPLSDVGVCWLCSTQPRGAELQFVSVDNNPDAESVPAGLLETKQPGAVRDVHQVRDAFGRGSITVSVEKPTICSACLAQMGALVGLESIGPWAGRVRELQQTGEQREATIERKDARIAELENAVRQLQAFETVRNMPAKKPAKPAKPAPAAA